MKLRHQNITSAVFELVKTFELDVEFGDDLLRTRIELFRDTEREDHFRCHVWEIELFRLTPRFPDDENHEPTEVSDDLVLVDRGIAHSQLDYDGFFASSIDAALKLIIADLDRFLEHATRERIQIG